MRSMIKSQNLASTSAATPEASAAQPAGGAAAGFAASGDPGAEFLDACGAARKAWHRTNLLAMARPQVMKDAKEALKIGKPDEIVAILREITGPVQAGGMSATALAHGPRHAELAGILTGLAVRRAVNLRRAGGTADVDAIKRDVVSWIRAGTFAGAPDAAAREAAKIALLLGKEAADASRLRLAVVAPLAAAIESLLVVSRLNDEVLGNLVRPPSAPPSRPSTFSGESFESARGVAPAPPKSSDDQDPCPEADQSQAEEARATDQADPTDSAARRAFRFMAGAFRASGSA